MVDVNDVQRYAQKFRNQLDLLESADIDETDRQEIRSFIRHEDANDDNVGMGAIVSHLNRLRLSAERGQVSLTEMTLRDIDDLMFALKHDHDSGEGTRRNYRKALRAFFQWRGEDWAEDIIIGPSPQRTVDPNDLLTDTEIDEMLDVADHVRDKAAVAILADSGLRIGALASFRVRDVDLSGRIATVSINEQANVKNATGSVPLTWSKGYAANWLDIHPRRDEPSVAFIHKLQMFDEDDDGALTYQYLSRRIKKIGEKAGIEPDRLNTHNFRKSAISRWIREGLSEQEIKHRAHWVKDSSQFEIYSGVTDEELNEQIAARYGIVDEDDAARPAVEECTQCQTPLRPTSRFCPGCGAPLTAVAAQTTESIDDDIVASLAEGDLPSDQINKILEFREEVKANPALRTLLLDA